jgi:putative transposase
MTAAISARRGAHCPMAAKYPRLCNWVEDNIEETLTYYRLSLPHHKHMKSTNMLERLNQER